MSVPSNTPTGKYIVIEGIEAVGKSTVIQMLARELQAAQIPVQIVAAPDQQHDITTQTIQRLVDDPRYPTTERTDTLLVNAVDSQSLETIRQTMNKGIICLADRSYLTTLVTEYYGQGNIADYNLANQISSYAASSPQPDLLIVLDAPVNVLKSRVSTERAAALQESYLERVRAGYLWEARQRKLPIVYTTGAIDAVFHNVWEHVTALLSIRQENNGKPSADTRATSVAEVLAANPPAKAAPAEPSSTQPDSDPSAGGQKASETSDSSIPVVPGPDSSENPSRELSAGKEPNGALAVAAAHKIDLTEYITNADGPVYSFTAAAPTTTIVTAMAQLSSRGDDVRTTLLRELSGETDEVSNSHSVEQLTGQYVVVEDASQLLVKKLQWGSLAAYVEQPRSTIAFDQKDVSGHYHYYLPPQLKGKLRSQYTHTMNQLFDTYSKLVGELTTHIRAVSPVPVKERDAAWQAATRYQALDTLRPLLPVAAKSTVGMYASSQSFENLSIHLLSDELPESRTVGGQLLEETRKAASASLAPTDKTERSSEANIAYQTKTYASVKKLAQELLPPNHTAESSPVNLVSYTPHNELDIIADILYEHSDLPLEQLQHEVASWPYQRKVDVLSAYVGERANRHQRPGRALENVRYSFDLVCDYDTFGSLQRQLTADNPEWQPLSPRLGYRVPKLVEETGLADAFDQCFDLSLRLYSELQAGGFPLEAQYATLLGHKLRWKVTYSAHKAFGLHELRTNPRISSDHRRLVQQMHATIAEVHPLLAEAMRFAE